MKEDVLSSMSRSAQEQILLQEEILSGKYGLPGDQFITTRHLAESRGVSLVTAHNILSGLCASGYLSLQGKKYFLSHADLLAKHDNLANILGVLVPSLNNEFYSSISNAVSEAARIRGYSTLVVSASYAANEERKSFELLKNLDVAGIINCVPTLPDNEGLYRSCQIPCLFLGHTLDNSGKNSVQVNAFPISQKVARHLIDEGYENFLYIGTTTLPLDNDVRFAAFQMELSQNGYLLRSENTIQINPTTKSDRSKIIEVLSKQSKPVGVFCYHDLIAASVYRACKLIKKRIPEDVGIVGFDDLSIASTLDPPLTSVRYRIKSMADMATDLIISSIKNGTLTYDNYYVDPTLIVRESSLLSTG